MSDAKSCTRSVKKNLADFLKANMPSIKEAYDDFPTPNQTLKMPCLSVFSGVGSFLPCPHYQIFKGPTLANNTALIRRVVGWWDYSMQIDLWAPTKFARDTLIEEITQAFNVKRVPGISILMPDYFDMAANYTLARAEPKGEEFGSQAAEWRAIASVLASSRAVKESYDPIMVTIENNLSIEDEIPEP